jgi:hypothetical protein
MNRWYGNVGYVETVETEPGVWEERETVRSYFGELVRNTSKFQTSGGVNDDRDISVEISIVADPYADIHFPSIRFVEFGGVNWKVTAVQPKRPRLILTLGGEYNG